MRHKRIGGRQSQLLARRDDVLRLDMDCHPVGDDHRWFAWPGAHRAGDSPGDRGRHGIPAVCDAVEEPGDGPIGIGHVVLGVDHRDRRSDTRHDAHGREMGVDEVDIELLHQAAQPAEGRRGQPALASDHVHLDCLILESADELVLPGKHVGDRVVERVPIPEPGALRDQLLRPANSKTLDQDQDTDLLRGHLSLDQRRATPPCPPRS